MRVHLAVTVKRPGTPLPPTVLAVAREAITRAFPVPAATVTAHEWHSATGGTALLSWSNEPEGHGPPIISSAGGRVAGLTGHLAEPSEADRLLAAPRLGAAVLRTGGCFSIFRADDEELSAATGFTRACPVFHTETSDVHVVGSRALLVHLVARATETASSRPGIVWDLPALQSMVRIGYFLSDETPFDRVGALPPAAEIRIAAGRRTITVAPLPEARPKPTSKQGRRAQVAELADALLTAVRPLRDTPEPVRLSLTGGRDSRLLAALLHSAGIPFTTATSGPDDHPDVVIARRVAAALGVEHRAAEPKRSEDGADLIVPHPLVRSHNALAAGEGMISAYENVPGAVRFDPTPRMSGHGGEILRGGFLYNQAELDQGAVLRRVDTLFGKNADLLTRKAGEHGRALAAPWQDRCRADGVRVLDHLYLTYRVGRWHAASRASLLRTGNPVPPFLDNLVVRAALGIDPLWRRSEEVVHDVITAFAPQLRGVPVEGSSWRFETEHPDRTLMDRLRLRWRALGRPAVGDLPGAGGKPWNWRLSPSRELADLLWAGIAGPDTAGELAHVFDETGAATLSAAFPERRMDAVWNVYTVSTMLTGAFSTATPPSLPPLRVPAPAPR
ncbi:asparagine synthase-related protein [Streptosporangium sp. NBC_01756]|uniref:asparagine synthase-related protein n=1 Tax=Streptosporangium sp. NBC_01756 TaxID=2975950 RepID=UPI002DD7F764|nr:asparagine synthase-related protein [Streptosporangium sp. NBC_01756]WSC88557.1 asparagine synthase-related protein [Streptosporangium sp. NBC_01756]